MANRVTAAHIAWLADPQLPRHAEGVAVQQLREDPDAPADAVANWYQGRGLQAEWTLQNCGDLYAELGLPDTTPTAEIKWLLKSYMMQFHTDKIEHYDMQDDEKALWKQHGLRVGNFKELVENELNRYIYDRVRALRSVPFIHRRISTVARLFQRW